MSYEKAVQFASEAHKNQKRFDGSPYIAHPIRVSQAFEKGSIESIVALLHDVVEDCGVSLVCIDELFGSSVADAVDAISKREGEDYWDYMDRVASNQVAIRVKIADISDNAAAQEFPPEKAEWRRNKLIKYEKALLFLKAQLMEDCLNDLFSLMDKNVDVLKRLSVR